MLIQDDSFGTVEVIEGSYVYMEAPDQQEVIFLESEEAPDMKDLIEEVRVKALEIKQRMSATVAHSQS